MYFFIFIFIKKTKKCLKIIASLLEIIIFNFFTTFFQIMSEKTQNIINWLLGGLVAFIFIGSGANKIMGSAETLEMAKNIGIDGSSFATLGVIEIVAALLFLYPRTGILGMLILVAYMGGAVATHLEHAQSIVAPCAIAAFLWIAAVVRFPELRQRIVG